LIGSFAYDAPAIGRVEILRAEIVPLRRVDNYSFNSDGWSIASDSGAGFASPNIQQFLGVAA
jgi:hypothetical protein